MMRPNAKVEKVYLYPNPAGFRKSIDGLAALVEHDTYRFQQKMGALVSGGHLGSMDKDAFGGA